MKYTYRTLSQVYSGQEAFPVVEGTDRVRWEESVMGDWVTECR